MIKLLNLKKLWEVCNTLSNKQSELSEQGIYIYLLGHSSEYSEMSFENFLGYYSLKVETDSVIVFNNDSVAWEDFTNDDFSYIPFVLLSFSAEKLNEWVETEIELQLAKQKRDKVAEKEELKRNIEMMTKRLNNL